MILKRIAEGVRSQDWFVVMVKVAIVVVGIFIGLQVDGWNDGRKERALERGYLVRLSQELESDISNYDRLEQLFDAKRAAIYLVQDLDSGELFDRPTGKFLSPLSNCPRLAHPATPPPPCKQVHTAV